jgi:hypothetical protein
MREQSCRSALRCDGMLGSIWSRARDAGGKGLQTIDHFAEIKIRAGVRIFPPFWARLLVHQKENPMPRVPGSEVSAAQLVSQRFLKRLKCPVFRDLDFDGHASIGNFRSQADISSASLHTETHTKRLAPPQSDRLARPFAMSLRRQPDAHWPTNVEAWGFHRLDARRVLPRGRTYHFGHG